MKRLLLAATGVLCFATAGWAAELNPAQVSADAQWLMHVDADRARKSETIRSVREAWLNHAQIESRLDFMRDRYGIDPRAGLHGVTLYGTTYEPHGGVCILAADFDPEKVEQVIRDEPSYQTTKYGNDTIHSWTSSHRERPAAKNRSTERETAREKPDAKRAESKASGHPMAAAFRESKLAVIAGSVDSLKKALDVLDGKAESAKGKAEFVLAADVPSQAIFHGAARKLESIKDHPRQFAILQHTDHMTVALAETDDGLRFTSNMHTKSNAVAQQVQSVVEGLRALLQLQAEADAEKQAANAAEQLKVTVNDAEVDIDWSISTAALEQLAAHFKHQQARQKADKPAAESK